MRILRLTITLLAAFAVAAVQVTPSLAAAPPVAKKAKYETREALVLLSQARYEQIKSERKDLARAFETAKKRGTKVQVSQRDAHWLMAQSRKAEGQMKGAGSFAAALPVIIVAIPIVYRIITNGRNIEDDFPFLRPIACIASIFYPPIAGACGAPSTESPGGGVAVRSRTWWERLFQPQP